MQSNLAYTPGLDGLNDRRLLAPDGPDRVLLNGNTYTPQDTRLASWDQPRTARSLLCHFRPVASSPTWLALARGPSRCGAERLVGSVKVPFNANSRSRPRRRGAAWSSPASPASSRPACSSESAGSSTRGACGT